MLVCMLMWGSAKAAAPQVPMTAEDRGFVRALHERWYLPGAETFGREAAGLRDALGLLCGASGAEGPLALATARAQWLRTVDSWERFSAVRGGALLARRSPREIDFMPTRPDSIRRAIDTAPDAAGMERVGAPAKGLPALEWLLWTQPVQPGAPGCRYAVRVAGAVVAEADALRGAYALAVQHGWDDAETEYALYEFLNLLDAGVQKLWWEDMDRPQEKAATGARAADFSRTASGGTVAAWRAHWHGLRALLIGEPSLGSYLRAKGHAAEAEALLPRVERVDRALEAMPPGATAPDERIAEVVAALKALQQHIEDDTANALQFVISFFDEDGD
ncbi:MAG: hypothetical protein KF891_13325 [Rhizobacter sp.]|nr:hypothetical protein [Rhizobacter sp.]